jgi:lysozyme
MKGIDISKYQGTSIDFKKVKAAGYEFVLINAGYGNSALQGDPQFDKNVTGALAAGLYVGAYYVGYATSVADALVEAATLRSILTPYVGKLLFPIAYDYEYAGVTYYTKVKGVAPSRIILTQLMLTFLTDMRKHGWFPANYTNGDFLKNYIYGSALNDFPTWLADYSGDPDFACTIQQTSESGTVPGIDGHLVDLNTSFVDYPSIIKAAGLNGYKKASTAITCDTTEPVSIAKEKSYTALISAPSKPTMTVGTNGVAITVLTQSGDNWLFKITAVGNIGDSAGIFANGQKLFAVNIK